MTSPYAWTGSATPTQLLAPAAVTTATNSSSMDTTNFHGNAKFIINSAAGTSDTLTTNGVFSADSGWTKGTGWSIAAGVATATAGTASDLKQNQALTEGVRYTVTYTLANVSAGSIVVKLGGTSGTTRTANGTYTEVIVCGAGVDPKLVLAKDATFAGDVDNVICFAAKLVIKVQESDDDSTYTDVTGAVTGAADCVYGVAKVTEVVINLDKSKRYVRAVMTPSGSNASFTVGVSVIAKRPYSGAVL